MPTEETTDIVSGIIYADGIPIGKINGNGECSPLPDIEFTPKITVKNRMARLKFWLYYHTWGIRKALFRLRIKFL